MDGSKANATKNDKLPVSTYWILQNKSPSLYNNDCIKYICFLHFYLKNLKKRPLYLLWNLKSGFTI